MAIALVQTTTGTTGATNATTLTSGSLTLTKNNTVFAGVATSSSAFMSDNANIAWRGVTRFSTIAPGSSLWAGTVLTTGSTTLTANAAIGAAPIIMVIAEFSSTYRLILDQQATNFTSAVTTADSGTTGTTVNPNELMVAVLSHRLQNSSTTATFSALGNSFVDVVSGTSTPTNTNGSSNNNTSGNDREVCLCYKIVTATGTGHATATVTTSGNVCGCIMTFYEDQPPGFFIG